jgi:hypothetical protein
MLQGRERGLEHDGVRVEPRARERQSGAAQRHPDGTDRLPRHALAQDGKAGHGILRLEMTESDAVAAGLAVRAEIGHEHRVAGAGQQLGAAEHLRAVGADAVQDEEAGADQRGRRKKKGHGRTVARGTPESDRR